MRAHRGAHASRLWSQMSGWSCKFVLMLRPLQSGRVSLLGNQDRGEKNEGFARFTCDSFPQTQKSGSRVVLEPKKANDVHSLGKCESTSGLNIVEE